MSNEPTELRALRQEVERLKKENQRLYEDERDTWFKAEALRKRIAAADELRKRWRPEFCVVTGNDTSQSSPPKPDLCGMCDACLRGAVVLAYDATGKVKP